MTLLLQLFYFNFLFPFPLFSSLLSFGSSVTTRTGNLLAMLATNNPKEAFGARIRLAWALAHSERGHQDYVRAKSMTTALLEEKREDLDTQKVIELLYVKAVANLNAGDLITGTYMCVGVGGCDSNIPLNCHSN